MIKNVYIHIPFCKYICSYCDFCKKYIKNQPVDDYLIALDQEIGTEIKTAIPIDTLYIGGGTPSALNLNQLKNLAMIIAKYFVFNPGYEFTFECNPDDINEEMLEILQMMKVNRISMGVQTLDDTIQENLNRKHTAQDVEQALSLLHGKIDNVSCDFIFNLPEQTYRDIENVFNLIDKYSLNHVSYYGLILEENTILDTKEYELQNEMIEVKWYEQIQAEFKKRGFEQYEISNFAQVGYQSQHNFAYWLQKEYYGFGLGASGYVDQVRYTNTKSLQAYLQKPGMRIEENKLAQSDLDYEKIFLNLRTNYGLELNFVHELKLKYDQTYFEINNDRLRIKQEYYYESNEHIIDLLMQLDEE